MPHPQTAAPKHTGKEVTTNSQQYLYHLVSTHNPAWTHNVYFWRQALRPMWCCLSPFVWCFVSCFVFASICDDWVAGLARPQSSKLSAVEWKKKYTFVCSQCDFWTCLTWTHFAAVFNRIPLFSAHRCRFQCDARRVLRKPKPQNSVRIRQHCCLIPQTQG